MTKDVLIVFAKPPIAGRVKTRLQPMLSADEAATLYHAFLVDAIRQFRGLNEGMVLYFSDGLLPDLDRLGLADHEIGRQRGADLGERLRNSFLDAFAHGAERVVVIGTDHPSLPTEFVAKAFEALSGNRNIVIGPSEDGGYYLLGMSEFFPVLFEDMRFSHGRVFDDTVDRAVTTQADLTILPSWYDVDTPELLPRLLSDLRETADHAPTTLRVLNRLSSRFH